MGRHAAMKPAADHPPNKRRLPEQNRTSTDQGVGATTAVLADADTVWSEIDEREMERASSLASARRQLPRSPHRAIAIDAATKIWVRTPPQTAATDRDAVTTVAALLLVDADGRGHVDPVAALEPKAIERELARNVRGWSETSIPTYRGYLTAAGRVVRPQDFPPLRMRAVEELRQLRPWGKVKGQSWTVASDAEVDNAYALVRRDARFAVRSVLILDLVTGAGLRARELRKLRFRDVIELRLPRGMTLAAVVVSGRTAEAERVVPIIDESKALRVLDYCRGKPEDHLVIAADGIHLDRNAVNRASERLRDRGYPGIDFQGIRNRWLLAMSCHLPAALLASLADISRDDLHRLVEASDIETDPSVVAAYMKAVAV